MFNWLKKKKQDNQDKEYSFIWYHKLEATGKVFYTQPFRTKVKAANFNEAREKAIGFALGKQKLMIMEEQDFPKSDLGQFERTFASLHEQMDRIDKKIWNEK